MDDRTYGALMGLLILSLIAAAIICSVAAILTSDTLSSINYKVSAILCIVALIWLH